MILVKSIFRIGHGNIGYNLKPPKVLAREYSWQHREHFIPTNFFLSPIPRKSYSLLFFGLKRYKFCGVFLLCPSNEVFQNIYVLILSSNGTCKLFVGKKYADWSKEWKKKLKNLWFWSKKWFKFNEIAKKHSLQEMIGLCKFLFWLINLFMFFGPVFKILHYSRFTNSLT